MDRQARSISSMDVGLGSIAHVKKNASPIPSHRTRVLECKITRGFMMSTFCITEILLVKTLTKY